MATPEDVERIAMGLEGTSRGPHFDRIAYKVRRIYATVAADGRTINLMLTPEEQGLKTMLAPEIFTAVAGGWGVNGATVVDLEAISVEELEAMVRMAWEHGRTVKPRSRL